MDSNNNADIVTIPEHDLAFIKSIIHVYTENRKVGEGTIEQNVKSLDCSAVFPGRSRGERKIGIICPECVSIGLTSRVHIGCGMRTHAGIEKYYDEAGRKHSHDRNVSRADWSCTQGHAGKYRSTSGCSLSECEKRGYTVLYTDPYQFKAARRERNCKEEEIQKIAREKAEAERIARGESEPTYDTSIGGGIGGGIGGSITIGRYDTHYPVATTYIGAGGGPTLPGYYYTSAGSIAQHVTVPSVTATATTATATVTTPDASAAAQPDTIQMEVTYGNRTYVGTLTAKPVSEDKKL